MTSTTKRSLIIGLLLAGMGLVLYFGLSLWQQARDYQEAERQIYSAYDVARYIHSNSVPRPADAQAAEKLLKLAGATQLIGRPLEISGDSPYSLRVHINSRYAIIMSSDGNYRLDQKGGR